MIAFALLPTQITILIDRSFCTQDKWQEIASAYNGIYQQIKQWVAIKHCDKCSFL